MSDQLKQNLVDILSENWDEIRESIQEGRKLEFDGAHVAYATYDGVKVRVSTRPKNRWYTNRGLPVKTRVYVWFAGNSEYKGLDDYLVTRTIDFHNVMTVDNKKYRAKVNWVRKHVVQPLADELGLGLKKAAHSANAGCSCGCSPGYILDTEKITPFDLFVDVL